MTWNVRLYDTPFGNWIGTVYGRTEQDARHAAIAKFNIPSDVRFEVSLR